MQTKIVQAKLNEQIFTVLKEKIVSGFYQPGTRLLIDTLAAEFNVSRTPIRDALQAMISNGLIIQVGKGYNVLNPTIEEVKDISTLRLALEEMAVEQCTNRCTEEEVKILESFYAPNKKFSIEEYDVAFHNKILEFSRNKQLNIHLHMVRDLWWLIRRWTKDISSDETQHLTIKQHTELIEKIKIRDVEGAKQIMRNHHNTGLDKILRSDLFTARHTTQTERTYKFGY